MTTETQWIESAEARETSREIMAAIWTVAQSDADEAERIWDDPTEAERVAICEISTNNGLRCAPEDFCWGACGSSWMVGGAE